MTQLDTTPASIDVTTDSRDTWAIAFAAALQAGESIASAAAALYTAMPGDDGAAVAGFVTGAVVSGTDVHVAWVGSVLARHSVYRLETTATLNTGAKIELLTLVRCVA
jgi:hypothetical protein